MPKYCINLGRITGANFPFVGALPETLNCFEKETMQRKWCFFPALTSHLHAIKKNIEMRKGCQIRQMKRLMLEFENKEFYLEIYKHINSINQRRTLFWGNKIPDQYSLMFGHCFFQKLLTRNSQQKTFYDRT